MIVRSIIFMVLILVILPGCLSPTRSKVTFYDKDGKIQRTVEAEESLIKTIVRAYKDHSVIWYDNGWHLSMKVTMTTSEDFFPTLALTAGKNDKATFILHRDHNLSVLPEVIGNIRNSSGKGSYPSKENITEPILISGDSPKTLTNPVYAYVNGTDVIYTVRVPPKPGDVAIKVTVMTGNFKEVGVIKAVGENSIVVDKKVYLRHKEKDKQPAEKTKEKPLKQPSLDSAEMVGEALSPDNVVSPESVLELPKAK